jgi:hypothetical protein
VPTTIAAVLPIEDNADVRYLVDFVAKVVCTSAEGARLNPPALTPSTQSAVKNPEAIDWQWELLEFR